MYILPYVLTPSKQTLAQGEMRVAWFFLTHAGQQLWTTDETDITPEVCVEQYLTPNGFHGRVKGCVDGVLFFEVDPAKTSFNDFYIWTEFLAKGQEPPPETDVWRPFFWLGCCAESEGGKLEDDAFHWIHETNDHKIGPIPLTQIWAGIGGLNL